MRGGGETMTTYISMIVMAGMIMVIAVFLMIFAISILKRNKEARYEVFDFSNRGEMKVLTGIPVVYQLEDIQKVVFSVQNVRSGSIGRFQIIKNNGKKSRKYMYEESVYTKKLSLRSSLVNIGKATDYLMQQLRTEGIFCEFEGRHMRSKV